MRPLISLLFVLLFIAPSPGLAESTGGCHCFRHRSFDPSDIHAADEYLLISSYNALIAATMEISKREIVFKKMKGGINGDDLLIGLYVAQKSGSPLDLLLNIRDNGGSWQDITASPAVSGSVGGDAVLEALSRSVPIPEVTAMITRVMLERYYHVPAAEIKRIQQDGFSDRETALLFALSHQTGTPLETLVKQARMDKTSWSSLAHSLGLDPDQVGKAILEKAGK